MLRQSKVISVSLPESVYTKLERMRKREEKSRSELIKNLIQKYEEEQLWQEVYKRGAQTKKQFNITSEEDILRIINKYKTIAIVQPSIFLKRYFNSHRS